MLLQPLLLELGSITIPAALTLPKVADIFSEDGELLNLDAGYDAKADRLIQQLDWYTNAIKNHQASVGPGPK